MRKMRRDCIAERGAAPLRGAIRAGAVDQPMERKGMSAIYQVIEVEAESREGVKAAVDLGLGRIEAEGKEIRFFVLRETELREDEERRIITKVSMRVGINVPVSFGA